MRRAPEGALRARRTSRSSGCSRAAGACPPRPSTPFIRSRSSRSPGRGISIRSASPSSSPRSRSPRRAGASSRASAFALSVLTKYVSLAAAPVSLRRRRRLRFAAAAAVLAAALWFAAVARRCVARRRSLRLRDALGVQLRPLSRGRRAPCARPTCPRARRRRFLDWKARLGHPAWTQAVFPYFYDGFFARAAARGPARRAACSRSRWRVGTFASATFRLARRAPAPLRPTLHPWYLLWILPFAAERREPAFLYLSLRGAALLRAAVPGAGPARS